MLNMFAFTNERSGKFEGIVEKRYQFALKHSKGRNVLDIGTGLGGGADYLARNGANNVLGIDISRSAIAWASEKYQHKGLKYQRHHALKLDQLKNKFDVAIAYEIIEHLALADHLRFIKQICQVLNHRGLLLLSTPNKLITSPNLDKPHNPFHTKEYLPSELTSLLKKVFSQVDLHGVTIANKQLETKINTLHHRPIYKLVQKFNSLKLTHIITPLIPTKLKHLVTKEDQLGQLKAQDFKVVKRGINSCEGLLAVCQTIRV